MEHTAPAEIGALLLSDSRESQERFARIDVASRRVANPHAIVDRLTDRAIELLAALKRFFDATAFGRIDRDAIHARDDTAWIRPRKLDEQRHPTTESLFSLHGSFGRDDLRVLLAQTCCNRWWQQLLVGSPDHVSMTEHFACEPIDVRVSPFEILGEDCSGRRGRHRFEHETAVPELRTRYARGDDVAKLIQECTRFPIYRKGRVHSDDHYSRRFVLDRHDWQQEDGAGTSVAKTGDLHERRWERRKLACLRVAQHIARWPQLAAVERQCARRNRLCGGKPDGPREREPGPQRIQHVDRGERNAAGIAFDGAERLFTHFEPAGLLRIALLDVAQHRRPVLAHDKWRVVYQLAQHTTNRAVRVRYLHTRDAVVRLDAFVLHYDPTSYADVVVEGFPMLPPHGARRSTERLRMFVTEHAPSGVVVQRRARVAPPQSRWLP